MRTLRIVSKLGSQMFRVNSLCSQPTIGSTRRSNLRLWPLPQSFPRHRSLRALSYRPTKRAARPWHLTPTPLNQPLRHPMHRRPPLSRSRRYQRQYQSQNLYRVSSPTYSGPTRPLTGLRWLTRQDGTRPTMSRTVTSVPESTLDSSVFE